MPDTNVDEFIDELGAGVVKAKIAHVLSETALAAVMTGKKGKISLEFTFTQLGDADQLIITTKLSQTTPTKRGKMMLEDSTDTAMFVGKGGVLSISPPREENGGQTNFSLTSIKDGK